MQTMELLLLQRMQMKKMYPASMTKVMTLLVAAEKLNNESLGQKIEISIEATDYSFKTTVVQQGFWLESRLLLRIY